MPRLAVLTVALSLAFAAVTGTIALTRTLDLGQAAAKPSVSSRALAKRTAQLNAFEASLHAQLERRPPRVPKLPPRSGWSTCGRRRSSSTSTAPEA